MRLDLKNIKTLTNHHRAAEYSYVSSYFSASEDIKNISYIPYYFIIDNFVNIKSLL